MWVVMATNGEKKLSRSGVGDPDLGQAILGWIVARNSKLRARWMTDGAAAKIRSRVGGLREQNGLSFFQSDGWPYRS